MTSDYKIIEKYLSRYAEPEARSLLEKSNHIESRWHHVVVLPVYKEAFLIEEMLASLEALSLRVDKCLAIFVINAKITDDESIVASSHHTLKTLLARPRNWVKLENRPPMWFGSGENLDFLIVDRFSTHPFEIKQGVGLARKLGCDLALALYSLGKITSNWIQTSDADVLFPDNYFDLPDSEDVAAISEYRHIPTDETALQLERFEAI